MTLHWWMHWFWVTALRLAVIMGAPSPLTTPDYTTDVLYPSIHRAEVMETTPSANSFATIAETETSPDSYYNQNYRMAKAIGSEPPGVFPKILEPAGSTKAINVNSSNSSMKKDGNSAMPESNNSGYATSFGNNGSSPSIPKKDSKITWIVTGKKNLTVEKTVLGDSGRAEINPENDRDDLAVLPLQEAGPTTRFKLVLNRTKFIPSVKLNEKVSEISSEQLELAEEEDIAPATVASISEEASESPRLSRARSAFAGEYQQDQEKPAQERQQIRLSDIPGNATSSAVDIAAVTGSCLASVVLLGTMGSLGFVMYRRRYLNPPQTLNSDKCSNPDSSGYIDDSTIRDNSEEMYSLDNDSFLNSLEAMTIQNYWTDSVKHTKL